LRKIIKKFLFASLLGILFINSAEAQTAAFVTDGHARFTILTPTLIRMEYAGDSVFEDRPSFNIINRNLTVPVYTTQVNDGWREIQTDKLLLRYEQNSGSFSDSNLTVGLTVNDQPLVVNPWRNINSVLRFNRICEAENATLSGGAIVAYDHNGYSGSGFVAGLWQLGAGIKWNLDNNLTSGDYTIAIRYSDGLAGDNRHIPRTISLYVDSVKTQILLDSTANWDTWNIFKKDAFFSQGVHTIFISCDPGDTYNVNIDWLAIIPSGGAIPNPDPVEVRSNLGGWFRGLDGQNGKIPLTEGLLSEDGWYMINDSETAIDSLDWVVPHPNHNGSYQDGYFFGYAHDYKTALSDFYKITGNPPLLPKWAFGIWFSRYYAYTDNDYRDTLLPKFRSEKVPLDVLVIDTDWKYPSSWDGWSWNINNFQDPQNFIDWTKGQGLNVTLNIHPALQGDDPLFAISNITAGGLVKDPSQDKYYFDFSDKKHIEAYFDLHKRFNDQGIRFWWLDWCCEGIKVGVRGLPGDGWINSLYTKNATDRGLRGFAFSRIGNGYESYSGQSEPGTSWAEHRYTVHFTGDTYATWEMLGFESYFTIREANIGLPYVTHDLGSFMQYKLDDDMYIRWIQFGTFQPVFRLHSNHGLRLPWDYPNVKKQAEDFMRLRHSLVPYIYSLAHESSTGGMPIVRGMYLYYPEATEAYLYDRQYMFGENVLVSPVTTSGEVASTAVWFPGGKWTNFFTNEIISGPVTKSISCDYSSMPVFIKEGGIIPLQPYSDFIGQNADNLLILRVYTGDDGSFNLYEDEGENLNYQSGKLAITNLGYNESQKTFTINATSGDYPGAPIQRGYEVSFFNFNNTPSQITVNDKVLNRMSADTGEGWWMENKTVNVQLNKRPLIPENIVISVSIMPQTLSAKPEIRLYPNPSNNNSVTIEYINSDTEPAQLNIFNLQGRKMYSKLIFNNSKSIIDARAFTKGIYIVNVKNSTSSFVEKLVVD
jgi:alpha-glucosidase (family GH31 glycosyl hydrolase)